MHGHPVLSNNKRPSCLFSSKEKNLFNQTVFVLADWFYKLSDWKVEPISSSEARYLGGPGHRTPLKLSLPTEWMTLQ